MSGQREMQRVRDGKRQLAVPCPQCGVHVGLWLCIQPPGEYQKTHPTTDLTASLLPPQQRADAMKRSADMAAMSTATPWVTCTFCGYDDQYTIGASS